MSRASVIKASHDPEHVTAVLWLSIASKQSVSAFSTVKAAVHSAPELHAVSIDAMIRLISELDLYIADRYNTKMHFLYIRVS